MTSAERDSEAESMSATQPGQTATGQTETPATQPGQTGASQPTAGQTDNAGAATPNTRPRRIWIFGVVAVLALGLDLLSKALVVAKLGYDHTDRILGGAIYLDETRNAGAAFSTGTSMTIVLTAVAVIVVVVILRVASRMRSVGWAIALGLILGGALGNLVDRFFRAPAVGRGHVVDWISVFGPDGEHWPIFNLADSAIVCGAILAALIALLGIDIDGVRKR